MTSQRLNILFTSSWYPNRSNVYAGNFVKRHAEAVANYCDVTVVYFQSDTTISKTEIQIFEKDNLREVVCYYPKITSRIPMLFHFINFKRIVSIINKIQDTKVVDFSKFDVLHHHVTYPMGTVAAYINNKFFLPLVLTEHSTKFLGHPDDTMTIVERLVAKYVLKRVDVLCPVSKNLEQAILKDFSVKSSVVVKNVVDADLFKPTDRIHHPIKTLLHISTLQNQQKNIDGLINAVAELSKLRSDFHLKIIGDGPSDELMSAIKKHQLSETYFTFLGAQPITKVADEMKQGDALVLFSNFENLPCVISEAHVAGIPVISSKVGGINEMIDASNGLLIDAKNTQHLLNALNDFLDGKYTFHSQEISNKAIENYSYEAVGKQFLNVYHSVLKK